MDRKRGAAGGRNQAIAMVRSVANTVTLLASEDHDGASASVPRLLRRQEEEMQMNVDGTLVRPPVWTGANANPRGLR